MSLEAEVLHIYNERFNPSKLPVKSLSNEVRALCYVLDSHVHKLNSLSTRIYDLEHKGDDA